MGRFDEFVDEFDNMPHRESESHKRLRRVMRMDEEIRREKGKNSLRCPIPEHLRREEPATLIARGFYTRVEFDGSNYCLNSFPETDKEMFPICFHKEMRTSEALFELDRKSLRPAGFVEILIYGVLRSEVQRRKKIVALACCDERQGKNSVRASTLCLCGNDIGRALVACNYDSLWTEDICFLAVPR